MGSDTVPKKKVLFVTNTMGQAGAETAMIELMKALGEDSEISLFSLIPRGEMYARLPENVHVLNRRYSTASVMTWQGTLRIVQTLFGCFFRRGAGVRCFWETLRTFLQEVREGKLCAKRVFWRLLSEGSPVLPERFDLAIANLEGAAAYYVADRVQANRKVGFIHIDYVQAGYSAELDHSCYEAFDAVFPISEDVRASFLRVYPQLRERTHVFENLLDRERILKLAQSGEGFTDACPFRVLTVARLHPQKCLDISVRAAALLRERGLRFRWYVAGEGGERAPLEKLIRTLGLEDCFSLLGFVQNPYPLLRQADLYVHATGYEGKSIAIAEAQTLKKAIVASDIPGNREQIIPEQNGLLVPLEPAAIAGAVLRLAGNPALRERFGEAAGFEYAAHSDGMETLKKLLKG